MILSRKGGKKIDVCNSGALKVPLFPEHHSLSRIENNYRQRQVQMFNNSPPMSHQRVLLHQLNRKIFFLTMLTFYLPYWEIFNRQTKLTKSLPNAVSLRARCGFVCACTHACVPRRKIPGALRLSYTAAVQLKKHRLIQMTREGLFCCLHADLLSSLSCTFSVVMHILCTLQHLYKPFVACPELQLSTCYSHECQVHL